MKPLARKARHRKTSVRDDRAALGVAGETFEVVCCVRSRVSQPHGNQALLIPLEPGVGP
jgi:hypothetical protein